MAFEVFQPRTLNSEPLNLGFIYIRLGNQSVRGGNTITRIITRINIARKGGADRHISPVLTSGGESAFVRIKAHPKGGVR